MPWIFNVVRLLNVYDLQICLCVWNEAAWMKGKISLHFEIYGSPFAIEYFFQYVFPLFSLFLCVQLLIYFSWIFNGEKKGNYWSFWRRLIILFIDESFNRGSFPKDQWITQQQFRLELRGFHLMHFKYTVRRQFNNTQLGWWNKVAIGITFIIDGRTGWICLSANVATLYVCH